MEQFCNICLISPFQPLELCHSGQYLEGAITLDGTAPIKRLIESIVQMNYIKNYNFENVFKSKPEDQAQIYSEVLIEAFQTFVPTQIITIRQNIPPWCNTYTRLLMRKKNRNYHICRKAANKYEKMKQLGSTKEEVLTRLRKTKEK